MVFWVLLGNLTNALIESSYILGFTKEQGGSVPTQNKVEAFD